MSEKLRDIRQDRGTKKTVMLRERVFRVEFELSYQRFRQFLRRHRCSVIAVCALIAAGVFARLALVGFASTADFYPSSCLGSWDNVQNALGKPDLPPGSSPSAFTPLNSAVFSTGTAQVFCGNFTGAIDMASLRAKSFRTAQLVLSWYVALPQSAGGGVPSDAAAVASGTVASDTAASDVADASTSVTSTDIATTSTVINASTTNASDTADGASSAAAATSSAATALEPPPSNASSSGATQDSLPASSISTSTPAAPASNEATPATPPESTGASDSVTTPASTPPPADAPAPSTDAAAPPAEETAPADATPPSSPPPASTDASAPSSWLFRLIPTAFADDSSTALSTISSSEMTAVDGAMATGTPAPEPSAASSAVEGVPSTSTIPAPITINTSAFENIPLPSSTPGDFLSIVYSTDGVTWQPVANISAGNWQSAPFTIPITSWDELEHLQIAFVGTGAPDAPKIYLDAADVQVSYDDGSDAASVSSDASSTSTGSSTVFAAPSSSAVTAPAKDPLNDIFDPAAGQRCSVSPFSDTAQPGGSASYLLALSPPVATAPTSTASSTAAQTSMPPPVPPAPSSPPLFDVSLGSLPAGVLGHVTAGATPGIDTIGLTIAPTTARGSYVIVAVYRERQLDGKVLPNFCQFNLVIE